jgi:hypothetical protein
VSKCQSILSAPRKQRSRQGVLYCSTHEEIGVKVLTSNVELTTGPNGASPAQQQQSGYASSHSDALVQRRAKVPLSVVLICERSEPI